jgi:hypothetical protein
MKYSYFLLFSIKKKPFMLDNQSKFWTRSGEDKFYLRWWFHSFSLFSPRTDSVWAVVTKQALLAAAHEFFDRFKQCLYNILLSVIGSHIAEVA